MNQSTHVTLGAARNGTGLFAAKDFRVRDMIIPIVGRVVHLDVLWERGGRFMDNCYRFGPVTYLDPGDGPSRYANHSCEPNAGVVKAHNRLYLFAAQPIAPGDEIVLDYSTILGDDDVWVMRCNCGKPTCRKRIRRFGSLPLELQRRYLSEGLVPKYIIDTLR